MRPHGKNHIGLPQIARVPRHRVSMLVDSRAQSTPPTHTHIRMLQSTVVGIPAVSAFGPQCRIQPRAQDVKKCPTHSQGCTQSSVGIRRGRGRERERETEREREGEKEREGNYHQNGKQGSCTAICKVSAADVRYHTSQLTL